MALVNPGLAKELADATAAVQRQEWAAKDNTVEGATSKQVCCDQVLVRTAYLQRADGTNALDYDEDSRTPSEQFYKREIVQLLNCLVGRLRAEPMRTGTEVEKLEEILQRLRTTEDLSWEPEIIQLGQRTGITVARARTEQGVAELETPGGTMVARVLKAASPDVTLDGAWVYLVEELPASGESRPTGRYALMVDDSYWGRRIQPAEFVEPPQSETIQIGYRLRGRVLENGQPVAEANVSLQLTLQTAEHGTVTAWDSLEFNELVYDAELETYVAGARVLAPIMTGVDGRWEFIAPRGHGAYYQRQSDRRDDTEETAERQLARYVERVEFAYRGRMMEVQEGTEAVLNVLSGTLEINAEPGTSLLVGTLDNPGQSYTVGSNGVVSIGGLPQAEHTIVAFRLTPWGEWDPSYGCARVIASVRRGETTTVTMPEMEHYSDPDVICGRVYLRPGVPAEGIEIVAVDLESCEIVGVIAVTDETGFWSATIPPEGLGGEPAIHDPVWGSVPVLGVPYSDVVLGARAYAAHYEMYQPETWRKPERGHANFRFCSGSVTVRTPEGREVATEATDYGGWVTTEVLPKHRYIEDIEEFVQTGAQAHRYDLLVDGEVAIAQFELRSQPFDGQDTPEGRLRAAGYYPEAKLLLGGKIHGNVLKGDTQRVKDNLPEAVRVGLEFGSHEPYIEIRSVGGDGQVWSCLSDLVCPYCGGPAHRDPDGEYLRGYCVQCAEVFQRADAMDCRGYFETPTLACGAARAYELWLGQANEGTGCWARPVSYHWRPDLYEESDYFLSQTGPGQPTNAPRWVARHVNEVGEGVGFGQFDGDRSPSFVAGPRLEEYQELPEIEHELLASQLKLVFPPGYVTPMSYTVEIDCRRVDDEVETVRVLVPEGARGPDESDAFGDVIRVVETAKLMAEQQGAPYAGSGLYVGVDDIRLVAPESAPGCRFTVVNDVPVLCGTGGVPVKSNQATPVALQIVGMWGNPHVLDDAAGQLMMFWADRGDIYMSKRTGLRGRWSAPRRITERGDADEPWAEKDDTGQVVVVCNRGMKGAQVLRSRDDGDHWEEV